MTMKIYFDVVCYDDHIKVPLLFSRVSTRASFSVIDVNKSSPVSLSDCLMRIAHTQC